MINPRESERQVVYLNFFVTLGTAKKDGGEQRQYTFAEARINLLGPPITVTFEAPSACQDEYDMLTAEMGGSAVCRLNDDEPGIAVRTEPAESEFRCARTNCKHSVSATFTAEGEHNYEMCWSHAVVDYPTVNSLFVPTENLSMSSSRCVVFASGSYGENQLKFIKDMENGRLTGGDLITMYRMESHSYPFFNLWLGSEPPPERCYRSPSGARIKDCTRARLISAAEVSLQLVPLVCGCPLLQKHNIGDAFVSLAIPERATRDATAYFADDPEHECMVLLYLHDAPAFRLDPRVRERYAGIEWIGIERIGTQQQQSTI